MKTYDDVFDVGDSVYIVSIKVTDYYFGRGWDAKFFNKKREIVKKVRDQWGSPCHYYFDDFPHVSFSSGDFCLVNTYIDPTMGLPDYMKEGSRTNLGTSMGYYCDYFVYKHQPNKAWNKLEKGPLWDFLSANTLVEVDPCRGCYADDCMGEDRCVKYKEGKVQNDKPRMMVSELNTNNACFASTRRIWNRLYTSAGVHPTRLLLKVHSKNIQDLYPEEIIKFLKNMKRCKALPFYLDLPSLKDIEKDGAFFNIRLNRISKQRLFWYLNVIRNIAEQPAIVHLTNHIIDEGGLGGLVAYTLGHVCLDNFYGGHCVMEDPETMRRSDRGSSFISPELKGVVEFASRCHKILTKKTVPYVTEHPDEIVLAWNLGNTINKTAAPVKELELTYENLHMFSVQTRDLTRRK